MRAHARAPTLIAQQSLYPSGSSHTDTLYWLSLDMPNVVMALTFTPSHTKSRIIDCQQKSTNHLLFHEWAGSRPKKDSQP